MSVGFFLRAWHVELSDLAGTWSVREDVTGVLDGASISARPHGGS